MPLVRPALTVTACLVATLVCASPASAVSLDDGPSGLTQQPGHAPPQGPLRRAAPVPGLPYYSFGVDDELLPVGDVDRNGSQDLLELRYRRGGGGEPTGLQLAVRGGTTGRVAWSREVAVGRDHYVSAFPVRVGRPALPGLVLNEQSLGGDGPPSQRLTALDGRTGRVLWSFRHTGRESERSYTLPLVFDELDGALVVGRLQHTRGRTDEDPGTGALRPLRLDLADGSVSDLGALITTERGEPSVVAVPDVSGDGRRDLAVLTPGAAGTLQVRSGTDGSVVWTTPPQQLWPDAQVLAAGALSGDRTVGDLALSTGYPLGPDGRRVPGARGEVALVSGRDGAVVWRRPGDEPVAVRAAGRPAEPALGAALLEASSAPDGTATATRTVTTYRPDGQQLSSASSSFTAAGSGDPAKPEDGPVAFSRTLAVSDLDRDGAVDLFSFLNLFGTDDDLYRADWLDGATGRRLPIGPDAEPLLGHLSSHGDDLAQLTPGNGIVVAGISGRTGRAVFRRVLARGTEIEHGEVRAVPVSGSSCDDVAVTATGPRDDVAAVLRADGTVRWSLRGPAGGAALRQPVAGPPTPERCV